MSPDTQTISFDDQKFESNTLKPDFPCNVCTNTHLILAVYMNKMHMKEGKLITPEASNYLREYTDPLLIAAMRGLVMMNLHDNELTQIAGFNLKSEGSLKDNDVLVTESMYFYRWLKGLLAYAHSTSSPQRIYNQDDEGNTVLNNWWTGEFIPDHYKGVSIDVYTLKELMKMRSSVNSLISKGKINGLNYYKLLAFFRMGKKFDPSRDFQSYKTFM